MSQTAQISISAGATVLVEGKLLSGSALLDYAKLKGLCPKCVQHTTHKRIKKRLGILRSEALWEPITLKDKEAGNYIVYKGYCLQPTCWTLAEAKTLLGETPTIHRKSSGRSRTTPTPLRDRTTSGSVCRSDDDSASVTPSENTLQSSDCVSVGSVCDQTNLRSATPPSSRSVTPSSRGTTPGRRLEESRMITSSRLVGNQGLLDRTTRVHESREFHLGIGSPSPRTSTERSVHSRDISLLGRQPSTSSIASDSSERSSHRRRLRNLGDIKIQESPREVRPAMFYRQADSSDNSDDDSVAILEKIEKTDSILRRQTTNMDDQATQRSFRQRPSIGSIIQATPRLLNNLLSDARRASTSCDCEDESTASKNEQNSNDSDSEVKANNVQTSRRIDNPSTSQRLRLHLGKGKSSSNIQNQRKEGSAMRRSSISHVSQKSNQGEERCSTSLNLSSPNQVLAESLCLSRNDVLEANEASSTHNDIRRPSSPDGRAIGINEMEQNAKENRIPLADINDAKKRSSFTTGLLDMNQQAKKDGITRRRASITHIEQKSLNTLDQHGKKEAVCNSGNKRDKTTHPRRTSFHRYQLSSRGASILVPSQASMLEPSQALLYRRISHSDASDDDNDSNDITAVSTNADLIVPVIDKHLPSDDESTASDLTKDSSVQSSTRQPRRLSFLAVPDQNYSENVSEGGSTSSRSNHRLRNDRMNKVEKSPCSPENKNKAELFVAGEQKTPRSTKRQSVPDIYILQHLCHRLLGKVSTCDSQGSKMVPEEHLWTSLHTRYGDVSDPTGNGVRKRSTLVNVLARSEDPACCEKCWALLRHLTKEGLADDQYSSDIRLLILHRVSDEFNRQNYDYNAKLHAAVTMSYILDEEQVATEKTAITWFHTMTTTVRLNWISVLSDVLNFLDFNHVEQRKEIPEVVEFACFLLETEAKSDEDVMHVHERNRLMNALLEVSVSILDTVCFDDERSMPKNGRAEQILHESCLFGAVLGLLSCIFSQATLSASVGRHAECIRLIRSAMETHTNEKNVYQGLLATKQIMLHLKPDIHTEQDSNETTWNTLATNVAELAHISLLFERKNPNPQLILETISMVTLSLELNEHFIDVVTNSVIMQEPMVVEAVVRLIDTGNDKKQIDEGFFTLLCLVTKNPMSGKHLRQIHSIASRLVTWLTIYRNRPVLQEFICLIIEYLVASEDDTIGQEFGSVGGLQVLSEVLKASANTNSNSLNQAASRALVGVLAVVDKKLVVGYNALVKNYVVDPMSANFTSLNLQLAGLNVLYCVCIRGYSVAGIGEVILPVVIKSMESHFGNTPLLTMCCTIIRKIAAKLEDWSVMIETEAVRTVVNTLLVHPTSTELVLEGMATIKDLAGKKLFRPFFNPEDAEIAIVTILPLHIQNPEVVSLVFGSLNNIAVNVSDGKVAPMQLEVLHFILSAATDFPQNHRVIRNACLLLKSYTYNETNLNIIRSYSNQVLKYLSVCSSSPYAETRDRAQYIMRKI